MNLQPDHSCIVGHWICTSIIGYAILCLRPFPIMCYLSSAAWVATACVFLQQNTSFGKFVDTNLAVNILKADTMYAWVTCMNEYLGPLWLPVKACEALVLSPWPSEANL